MKTPKNSPLSIFLNNIFSRVLTALMLLITILSMPTHAQSSNDASNIEQAQSALEEAQSALKNAQYTLEQAQQLTAQKTLKSKPSLTSFDGQNKNKNKSGDKLYKWLDEKGKVSYQDSPPPRNVKVINSDVLKDVPTGQKPVKVLRRAAEPALILDGSIPVMVYTADNCKPCQSVVLFLTQKQVPFIERDIRNDRRARDRLSKLSKQITVPSLFIGERVVQGNSKPMISKALKEAGYLKQ